LREDAIVLEHRVARCVLTSDLRFNEESL
jgi:hypothetical protein